MNPSSGMSFMFECCSAGGSREDRRGRMEDDDDVGSFATSTTFMTHASTTRVRRTETGRNFRDRASLQDSGKLNFLSFIILYVLASQRQSFLNWPLIYRCGWRLFRGSDSKERQQLGKQLQRQGERESRPAIFARDDPGARPDGGVSVPSSPEVRQEEQV